MLELGPLVGRHIANAERPGDIRADLFDRYMGELLGNEVNGRSKAMTSEVFDTVEALAAEIMDMVAADRDIVNFTAINAQDEMPAKLETAACNHVFWEKNNGFENLQTWLKAGLIEQVGYCRSGWVESEDVRIDGYYDLSIDDALALKAKYDSDPNIEDYKFLEMKGFKEDDLLGFVPTFDDDGMPERISFKIRCVKVVENYEIEPIPQSCVLVTPRWHKISLQDVPFLGLERSELTRSDWVSMGFHKDDVDKMSAEYTDADDDRHDSKDSVDDGSDSVDGATETVLGYECYVLADKNGDGVAERLKVWLSTDAKTVLRWADGTEAVEEIDCVDISAYTPILVPHRHIGRSVAETVDDIQAINTTLLRQTLDGTYSTLYPRPVVDITNATEHTFPDIAKPDHGAPIRVRGVNAVTWPVAPNIAAGTLPLMEKMNAIREERTGVTRLNQGMDSNTLNQTMGGQAQLLSQGQKRIKLIARNFAEGVRDLFIRMHRDLRRGNVRKLEYLHNGEWAEQDPMTWPERKAASVSVGTGNGNKDEKQNTLAMVGQIQRELAANGSDMVDDAKIFETVDRGVRMGGYSSATQFLNDPRTPEYQQAQAQKPPPEPDAATVLAQAEATKAQAMAAKAQAEAEEALARIKLDAMRANADHEYRMAQLRLQEQRAATEETKAAAKINADAEAQDLAELTQAQRNSLERDKLAVDIINAK